jgi:hypothetical protein
MASIGPRDPALAPPSWPAAPSASTPPRRLSMCASMESTPPGLSPSDAVPWRPAAGGRTKPVDRPWPAAARSSPCRGKLGLRVRSSRVCRAPSRFTHVKSDSNVVHSTGCLRAKAQAMGRGVCCLTAYSSHSQEIDQLTSSTKYKRSSGAARTVGRTALPSANCTSRPRPASTASTAASAASRAAASRWAASAAASPSHAQLRTTWIRALNGCCTHG